MFNPLGSLNTSSSPITPIPSNVVISTQPVQSDTDKLAQQEIVNKTFSNKTTYNPITSWTSISSMYGYASATPIEVTFYTINHENPNIKTYDSDFALNLGLTRNFLKISNFELRLDGELQYAYDTNTNISACTGSAFVYPRFDISIGDVFLYKMGEGTIGLFKVNDKLRLSIDKDSAHKIEFELNRFPTSSEILELDSYVDRTAYFFKDVFLNGKVGLIYDETFQLLQHIHKNKEKLLSFYLDKFYHTDYKILLRTDGVYDPYVIEFMFKFISFYKLPQFPLQLLNNITFKDSDIFTFLINPNKISKKRIKNKYLLLKKEYSHRDSDLSILINKFYISLVNNDTLNSLDYLLPNFINNNFDSYNNIEHLLENYVTNQTINPEYLITTIDSFEDLSDIDQFYYIPIYLYLLATLEGILYK